MTIAERIINFNNTLEYSGKLPEGINIMNPFKESPEAFNISARFYRKYYADENTRRLILGINPGRLGAGVTGVPFTDTKRMESHCKLKIKGFKSHELSAVFVYDFIDSFGGPKNFYNKYYINSVCPLGFIKKNEKGRDINYNYYDDPVLYNYLKPFIIDSIKKQISMGIDTSKVFCLGTGKNFKFLKIINREYNFFGEIIPLEHPRYIMQYKLKQKRDYINKFIQNLDF